MAVLLIVEDDTATNEAICEYMSSAGHTTLSAFDGEQGLQIAREKSIDLVVLDIMLPKRTGLEVLKELRQTSGIPVLMLTALDDEPTQAASFDEQADDYITKPFSIAVLCRKLSAVFTNMERRNPRHDLYDDGILKIDFSEQTALLSGESLDLTPKEYRTLFLFVKNPRMILTKRQLLERLWDIDGDFVDEHTLTTIISRIRKKIETDEHKYIKTAYGMGYQWTGGALK